MGLHTIRETFEKGSFLFKFKEGENFNQMNTLSISRIAPSNKAKVNTPMSADGIPLNPSFSNFLITMWSVAGNLERIFVNENPRCKQRGIENHNNNQNQSRGRGEEPSLKKKTGYDQYNIARR